MKYLAVALITCASIAAQANPRLEQSRALTRQFMADLKQELMAAMQAGGPVAAVQVCKVKAPSIAAELSGEPGPLVGRTSTRPRNPDNEPLPWQAAVLNSFELRQQAGEPLERIEYFAERRDGSARYMKAIGIQPLCLTCHGTELSPELQSRIDELYPQDQATGYELGQLRGAFSVVWPEAPAHSHEH